MGLPVGLLSFDSGGYAETTRCALAIAALWALGLGLGLRVWPRERPGRAALAAGAALAALCLAVGLSLIWASSSELVVGELNRAVLYLALYCLVLSAFPRGSAAPAVGGLVGAIVVVAVVSLAGRLFPSLGLSEPLSSLPTLDRRLSYPLGYWNGLGIFVALALPLLLGLAARKASVWRRAALLAATPPLAAVIVLTASRGAMLVAAVGVLAVPVCSRRRVSALAGFLTTVSVSGAAFAILHALSALMNEPRSGAAVEQGRVAAPVLLCLCLLAPLLFRSFELLLVRAASSTVLRARSVRLAGLLVALAVLAAGAVALDPVSRVHAFTRMPNLREAQEPAYVSGHLVNDNSSGRWQMWTAAVDELRAHPLLGGGAGSFASWWARTRPIALSTQEAHSLYLETAGELGLLGVLPLAALVGSAAWGIRRRLSRLRGADRELAAGLAAMLVGYAVAAGIDWMWEMTVVSVVAVAGLALVLGPALRARDEGWTEPRTAGPRRRGVVPTLVALASALLVVQGVEYLAAGRLEASAHAAARGDVGGARSAALSARALEPWAASPYLQLALLDQSRHRLALAATEIRSAEHGSPDDWRLWLVDARIALQRGRPADAAAALARARELNPRSPLVTE